MAEVRKSRGAGSFSKKRAPGGSVGQPNDAIRQDFRSSGLPSSGGLLPVRQKQEAFARGLAIRLSGDLDLEFVVTGNDVQALRYRDFVDDLNHQSLQTVFQTSTSHSQGLLEVSSSLALTIVDRLMGGTGDSVDLERIPTPIELDILDDVFLTVIREWFASVEPESSAEVAVTGHGGLNLSISQPTSVFVVATMSCRVMERDENIRIGFPYSALTILQNDPAPELEFPKVREASLPVNMSHWNSSIKKLQVRLSAESGAFCLDARRLTEFQPGHVISLPEGFHEEVTVSVEGRSKFLGRIGKSGKNWAVQISKKLAE